MNFELGSFLVRKIQDNLQLQLIFGLEQEIWKTLLEKCSRDSFKLVKKSEKVY